MKWILPQAGREHRGEVIRRMKKTRAGLLTKLVILALMIATATALLNLRTRIQTAQTDRDQMSEQVAQQRQVNADLSQAVENSDDLERQADIARDKLGLVLPGERIIYFTD